jgi:hypothetical protein
MSFVPCLVLNNNCSYWCGTNLKEQTLHSTPLWFPPFHQFREQDLTYPCSCNNEVHWKELWSGGQKASTPVPAVSLLSSCEGLRKATLHFCGFHIWKGRNGFDQRRSVRSLLVHHLNRGSQRQHLSWVPKVHNLVFKPEGSWGRTHRSQAHERPGYKPKWQFLNFWLKLSTKRARHPHFRARTHSLYTEIYIVSQIISIKGVGSTWSVQGSLGYCRRTYLLPLYKMIFQNVTF